MPWLIARFRSESAGDVRQTLAHLIRWVFNPQNQPHVEAVYAAGQRDPVIASIFSWWFNPTVLGSPEAERLKADHYRLKELRWERPPLNPPLEERMDECLQACEAGDANGWWRLHLQMTLSADGTVAASELEWDLTQLPGWQAASPLMRERILAASKRYVLEQDAAPQKWLGTDTFHRPAAAGYRALQLLLSHEPGFVQGLPGSVWERWAPIVVAYPTESGTGKEEPHQRLVQMAYNHVPEQVISTLMVLIDEENARHDHIFITRKMAQCWDDRLIQALLTKVRSDDLKPSCMGSILAELLEHGAEAATAYAKSVITAFGHGRTDLRERAIIAARELMLRARDAGWDVVWPMVQSDSDFGRAVVEATAWEERHYGHHIGQRLSERDLAALYVWVVRQYPHAEDPDHNDAHFVSIREQVADWRNSLLDFLRNRGTREACEAVAWVMDQLPELSWLPRVLRQTLENYRRRSWLPVRPAHLIKALSSEQNRLVQNGAQLLEVLVESLKRLEERLQGETPMAVFLWNEISPGVFRPKDEAALSDFIKGHLDHDLVRRGVVVNREVEIRTGEGSAPGERTDIHVDAVIREPNGERFDVITVIIEVKGSWHRELRTAMQTQLVERYLADNPRCHGLYVVGWFHCEQWDPADRRRRPPYVSLAEAQEELAAQAAHLSNECRTVRALVLNTALR